MHFHFFLVFQVLSFTFKIGNAFQEGFLLKWIQVNLSWIARILVIYPLNIFSLFLALLFFLCFDFLLFFFKFVFFGFLLVFTNLLSILKCFYISLVKLICLFFTYLSLLWCSTIRTLVWSAPVITIIWVWSRLRRFIAELLLRVLVWRTVPVVTICIPSGLNLLLLAYEIILARILIPGYSLPCRPQNLPLLPFHEVILFLLQCS